MEEEGGKVERVAGVHHFVPDRSSISVLGEHS